MLGLKLNHVSKRGHWEKPLFSLWVRTLCMTTQTASASNGITKNICLLCICHIISCRGGHYNNVIVNAMASQIASLTIVYSTVYSGADKKKHQSSTSLAFVRGIPRWPVNSPHKGPVMRKMFPFDDIIKIYVLFWRNRSTNLASHPHYTDVIMSLMASQITGVSIVNVNPHTRKGRLFMDTGLWLSRLYCLVEMIYSVNSGVGY